MGGLGGMGGVGRAVFDFLMPGELYICFPLSLYPSPTRGEGNCLAE